MNCDPTHQFMSSWLPPPLDLELGADEVHVWLADLEAAIAHLPMWQSLLAEDETARAIRFHFSQHRHLYTCGRGILRVILSRYLNLKPQAIAFSYGSHGKPFLAVPRDVANSLQFNLSHSGRLALYIVAQGRDVGVDVEQINRDRPVAEIITRFFTRSERAYLLGLPSAQQQTEFFRCWTCKEAQAKAHGRGIAQGLDQLDLGSMLASAARFTYYDRWSIVPLALPDWSDYAAAIAVAGQDWQLKCWKFDWQDLPKSLRSADCEK
ncbi:4'-phosphopantetheinyl transferase family protein [Pseudanabaena sp. PCC 6802]|uniref:4'-phosphopantetheinyl transferase family protein n=1 Tax=Pseudanabaena sp. PCC 6802 TaxID=118173 RepID=UPI00034AE774|nr:4'-phosphopantetheinyl transferase superfamily protein [Pseudanabaena sp. PCC 6802]